MLKDLNPCEICGKKAKLREAIVEGSVVSVCDDCLSFGKAVPLQGKKADVTPRVPRKIEVEREMELVVSNYSDIIKQGRERMDLTQEEFAKKLSERESVIHSLESGKLKPSLALARKLERFLGVKLIEIYKDAGKSPLDLTDSSLTIGDLLKMGKKK